MVSFRKAGFLTSPRKHGKSIRVIAWGFCSSVADFTHLATSLGLSTTQSHRVIARMCKAFQANLDEAFDASFLSKGFQARFREMAMSRLSVFDVE